MTLVSGETTGDIIGETNGETMVAVEIPDESISCNVRLVSIGVSRTRGALDLYIIVMFGQEGKS